MGTKRFANEDIIAAYRATGSVWKAGKQIGMSGQHVHERLRAIGHPMSASKWTAEEHAELRTLAAEGCTIGDIAHRLGRPYMGVAIKLSRLQIPVTTKRAPKLPRAYSRKYVAALVRELRHTALSLRQFSKRKGVRLDVLVKALQHHDPAFWSEWTKTHGLPTSKLCPNCGVEFYPMTKRQITCTRKCGADAHRDRNYFGGKRNTTVGLAERTCQLCRKHVEKGLTSHHVLGKVNDPNNDVLVALCAGCHKLLELLWPRQFTEDEGGWENLINLVLARRMAERRDEEHTGTHVCVDIDYLTLADHLELYPEDAPILLPPKPTPVRHKKGQPTLFGAGMEHPS